MKKNPGLNLRNTWLGTAALGLGMMFQSCGGGNKHEDLPPPANKEPTVTKLQITTTGTTSSPSFSSALINYTDATGAAKSVVANRVDAGNANGYIEIGNPDIVASGSSATQVSSETVQVSDVATQTIKIVKNDGSINVVATFKNNNTGNGNFFYSDAPRANVYPTNVALLKSNVYTIASSINDIDPSTPGAQRMPVMIVQ